MKNLSSILKLTALSLITVSLLSSCSKEELTIEEKLVGSWQGEVFEEDYGTSELNLDFQELIVNNKSGNWTTESKDLSICDPNELDCSDFICRGTFSYIRTENNTLFFEVGLITGPCWEEGKSTISFIDDNKINYAFTPPAPYEMYGISGVFERK